MRITPRFPTPGSPRDLARPVRLGALVEVYLVADGADVAISDTGPADYHIVADGDDLAIAASGTPAARLMKSTITGDVILEHI